MYHFDEIIDRRGTNALNTDGFRQYIFHAGPEKVFPYKDEEFVRMWVADMEFGVAPEILDAMRQRIDRRIFGYTGVYDDGYYQSFRHWCLEHYGLGSIPGRAVLLPRHHSRHLPAGGESDCPNEKVLINTPCLRLLSPCRRVL